MIVVTKLFPGVHLSLALCSSSIHSMDCVNTLHSSIVEIFSLNLATSDDLVPILRRISSAYSLPTVSSNKEIVAARDLFRTWDMFIFLDFLEPFLTLALTVHSSPSIFAALKFWRGSGMGARWTGNRDKTVFIWGRSSRYEQNTVEHRMKCYISSSTNCSTLRFQCTIFHDVQLRTSIYRT